MKNLIKIIINDFCGGRYPAGLFNLDKDLWTAEGVKQAAETGADFLVSVASSEPLLSLCKKYNLGIISNSNVPGWWGGDGSNAGKYAEKNPPEKIAGIAETAGNVWGDYLADEPNSKDFKEIDRAVKQYAKLYPGKLPFINLYPNYGKDFRAKEDEITFQLGNKTYAEHIDQYVRDIDLPYVCFDFYPFTGVFSGFLENLDIVAKACKKTGKDMWVIIQTGAWTPEEMLSGFQIDWQVYMSMAFGAKAIMAACYSKGWWDETTSCVNKKGEKNNTYNYVRDIFSILHSPFGNEFLKYEYQYTIACGDLESSDAKIKPQLVKLYESGKQRELPEIKIKADKAVIAGYFKNNDNCAVMLVNAHNPFDNEAVAGVKLETAGNKKITVYGNKNHIKTGGDTEKIPAVDLKIPAGQGVFITITR